MFSDRDTAGAAYTSALAALRAAHISLRAYDLACANKLVLAGLASGVAVTKIPVQTFANASTWPNGGQDMVRHPVFAPTETVQDWDNSAQSQARTLVANLS